MSQVLAPVAAVGSIAGGFGQAAALKSEAKGLEFQAKAERLRGKQISEARRSELNETLAAIDSIRVDRGLNIDSLGGMAIRARQRKIARNNENNEVLSSKLRETDLKSQAAAKRRAAPFAIIGGFASAAGSLASSGIFDKKSG